MVYFNTFKNIYYL